MARQLRHLTDAIQRSNVTLRVVPLSAGAYVGLQGSFVILEFAEEPDLVYLEHQTTCLFLEEEAELASYRLALRNILNTTLAPDATLDLITAILAEDT